MANKTCCGFWVLWTETSHSESGMLSARTHHREQKRRGYHTGRERWESNGESACLSKPLDSHLTEQLHKQQAFGRLGVMLVAPHGHTAPQPQPCSPMVRGWSVFPTAPPALRQPARFSPCVACLQVIWKPSGLLQRGIRVLRAALRQMAQAKQGEQSGRDIPTSSFVMPLCTEEGHTDHEGSRASSQPLSPISSSSSAVLSLGACWRSSGWGSPGQCCTQLHLTHVSHVEFGRTTEPHPPKTGLDIGIAMLENALYVPVYQGKNLGG